MGEQRPEIYIVATPIGNIDDITFRAVKILKEVDLIAAEDTRNTGKLLSYLGISKKMISMHEHNESDKANYLIDLAMEGKKIAVVSDAGTPLISDPGFRLVKIGVERGVTFTPIPGVSALTALISVCGLATDKFAFYGFLPRKESLRNKIFEELKSLNFPVLFFESPKRIIKTLSEIIEKTGNRKGVLGREMTKLHEEIIRGSLSEIKGVLEKKDAVKGEISLLVQGGELKEEPDKDFNLRDVIADELKKSNEKPKIIAKKIAEKYGVGNKVVYELILEVQGKK